MKIDRILDEYRQGNADTRVSLCLHYRELRDEFSDIELDGPMDLDASRRTLSLRKPLSVIPRVLQRGWHSMKTSSISMIVFAVYLCFLGLIFVLVPNPVIAFFGIPPTHEVWIRILGYILAALAFYYFMAVRENAENFYRWSVYARLSILPAFAAFVFAGIGPPIILLFGAFDSGCAIWTWYALNKEHRA